MRLLVTGSNGLLGRCLIRTLRDAGHDVTGTYHTRPAEGLQQMNVDDPGAVRRVIAGGGFSHVINCAALRSPDYCIAHPEEAYRVNSLAVEYVAQATDEAGAMLVQISTDYVFDGTRPPYREDDVPSPVNLYGRSKLAGEVAARTARRHLVVRIPALWRTDLNDARNVAASFARRLRAGQHWAQDSETVRYYTLADDVAGAIQFLIGTGQEGTIHLSAEEKTTKADFVRALATALGLDAALVTDHGATDAGEADHRPHDSHLDTVLYRSLGGPAFRSIAEGLRQLRG